MTDVLGSEIRPFPVASIRDQVMARLEKEPAGAVVLAVDGRLLEGGGAETRLAVMGKTENGWSFAGWLAHTSGTKVKDTSFGFEVRKEFR